jgi:RNA polymerase sigma-70 factor (ECF subfamily)
MQISYEHRLIERFQRGDHKAMELLVDHYIDGLLRFVMRIVGSREDAEDVVQDALIKSFERAYQFRGTPSSFGAWLYSIARSTALDRRRQLRFPFAQMTLIDDISTPVQPDSNLHALLWSAFERMSEDDQTVLFLCDAENMSHADVGIIMERSTAAISSQLYRARRRLRDEMARVKEVTPWIA